VNIGSISITVGHIKEASMTPRIDESPRKRPDGDRLTNTEATFPPAADGDPAANPAVPLDDMPVPPLTEPTDVSGG
jgi:hypothetical protein